MVNYKPIPGEEDRMDDVVGDYTARLQRRQDWHFMLSLVNILLFIVSLACLGLAWRGPQLSLQEKQRSCGRLIEQWLPDMENGVEYEVRRFKGSFGLKTEFTGFGPEVDAAWDNITEAPIGGAIGITKEQWNAVNSNPQYPVLLEQKTGTGQYLASLDVFHQLHCVDLLRKSLHREYYNQHEGSFAGALEEVVQGHLEHCVETLRQTLMCHGDVSLLTYNWVKDRSMPHPNFNTVHTCKKWDAIVTWNKAHDVSAEWVDGVRGKEFRPPLKPADVVGLSVPP